MPLLKRLDVQRLKVGEFSLGAFPSYLEKHGVWRSNKVLALLPSSGMNGKQAAARAKLDIIIAHNQSSDSMQARS